jgi:hypothetical protein
MTRVYPGSVRGPYVQQGCARGAVLRCTVVLAEGSYKQGGRGGEALRSPRFDRGEVPISWMWAEMCKCAAIRRRPPPRGPGTASSFYRRGGGLQSHRMALALHMAAWRSVAELMVVLENLAFSGRRGESCACPGEVSRVVV